VIVVDCSAMVTALRAGAPAPLLELLVGVDEIAVPHLLDVEWWSSLRGFARRGADPLELSLMQDDFDRLPLTRFPHVSLGARVWALRHNLSTYDAVYVALAEALAVPLVTSDARLASAPGILASVVVHRPSDGTERIG
jgi:predicted nucleic acid-binding protein